MTGTGSEERILVQIASYNTNLQGVLGLPQDLVDWLAPTLQVSSFLSKERRAPDIVAVGFQELLPLHLGLSGFSKAVIEDRNALILSQIEAHAPNKEPYSLIAKVVNVGIALLVYGRDDGVARKVQDVETTWTGCGPLFMGNKGAVGIRFRVTGPEGTAGETYTFVNCHLTAHQHNLKQRLADYQHIVGSLLFAPSANLKTPSTLYDTSHLFLLGDFNFRLDVPKTYSLYSKIKTNEFAREIESEKTREELVDFDQLTIERRKGNVFVGLREGDFWKFKCSYKYKVGEVDQYSTKRAPSWTDRVLYTTYSDSPDTPEKSSVSNVLYTSIPSYTTSDHKPVVAVLHMPQRPVDAPSSIPKLRLPASYTPTPDPNANLKRYTGRVADRIVGVVWWLFTLLGAGSGVFGIFNFIVGVGAWTWWRVKPITGASPGSQV
ncbi:inositol polyphosphate phosphatase [Panaeolus papilionaceus]|nr:inositol polyphosphate phosphatase [Panaeolus papilionaceus]